MNAFEYASPTGVEQATRALAGAGSSEALAGGTDLLCRMKDYISSPERVVDLRGLDADGFRGIGAADGKRALGGGVTLAEIVADSSIKDAYPALHQAALEVGTPQIRNMATLAGNLLQRPRCWYYRSGFGLIGGRRNEQGKLVRNLHGEFAPFDVSIGGEADDAHLVRDGDNRYHAIFMTDGPALFVNPSNLAPALIALGAEAEIVGPEGSRTVPVADLYAVPEGPEDRELTISTDEILTRVLLPGEPGTNAFYEIRQKRSHDWPLTMAAVRLEMNGRTVEQARVVLGAVAPIPYRSEAAEAAIAGKPLTRANAEAAGRAAVEAAEPLSKNAYKVPLTATAVKRALLTAAGVVYWDEIEA